MCRIFGHLHGAVEAAGLRRTPDKLRHGGPDDQQVHSGPEWALGSTRLAVMDVAHGRQPYELTAADTGATSGRIEVVFNGEIYNHDELRHRLEGHGYRFTDRCDGSILPALYHRYGADFVDHLDGMFAIAVLDLRTKPTLVLVTDEVGMKPLYYHRDGRGGLYFASEIPALRTLSGVGATPWTPGLDEYLTTKAMFGEQTMFRDIRVLPPGTTAIASNGAFEQRRRPSPTTACGAADPDAAVAEVRETVRRETHRLSRADVPVAAITSGGLDSSLVTAMLAERIPGLQAFHVTYRGEWPFDEGRFARMVTRRSGARLHEVEVDPRDMPSLLPEVVAHLGQPNADPITLSTFALFRAVRRAGFKVALTGDGADEVFGGYDRIRVACNDGPSWAQRYIAGLAAVPAGLRRHLYSTDYRTYLADTGTAQQRWHRALVEGAARTGSRLAAITELEVGTRMPAYHLRRVDHLSMASAVEVRLPFCQPAVTTLGTGLAPEQRVARDAGKVALTAAAAGELPEPVLRRPKQPFTLPIAAMLTKGSPLFTLAREVLAPEEVADTGLLDPRAVQQLLSEHATTPAPQTALAIWSLVIYYLWRRHVAEVPVGLLNSGVA